MAAFPSGRNSALFGLVVAACVSTTPIAAQRPSPVAADGHLEIVWKDDPSGRHERLVTLAHDDGTRTEVTISAAAEAAFGEEHGGIYKWAGRRVRASGLAAAPTPGRRSIARRVLADRLAPSGSPGPAGLGDGSAQVMPEALVSGSKPWISVLCKFSDNASEPKTVGFHQSLLGGVAPGMDQYWRQVSYDTVNIVGSQVVGWVTLPQPRSYYVTASGLDHGKAATDCTAAADSQVYFPNFSGINLMFNDTLDCCAWGGSWYLTLDGVSRSYSVTWDPPWAQNPAVMAHEMGHGFGLPHSANDYGYTYGSWWDIMSYAYNGSIAGWGYVGPETIAHHRDLLGWIPTNRIYNSGAGSNQVITLQRLNQPQSSAGYLMARVPIRGTSGSITVEVRQKTGTYDGFLPAGGVVVHTVLAGRAEPAHVIDHDLDGDAGDPGAALQVGSTYSHSSGIQVSVVSAGASSFQVRIRDGMSVARSNDFSGDGVSELSVYRPSGNTWYIQGGSTTTMGLASDILVPGDYNGDRVVEPAFYRPSTGQWYINGQAPVTFGQPRDLPVPADYDGNGTTDLAVYRSGSWIIANQPTRVLGKAGDVPVPADYTGDGRAEAAVFRRATAHWLIEGGTDLEWGNSGDIPVPADYSGDGVADLTVFRPSTGYWYVRNVATVQWGGPGDIPLALDTDGLGGAELVAFRPATSTWFTYNLGSLSTTNAAYGQPGDRPVGVRPNTLPASYGDVDPDRRADLRVFRPQTGSWYTMRSATGTSLTNNFGLGTDLPVSGDFDGDGRPDLAVFRPSNGVWYWVDSSTGISRSGAWGQVGDVPVPADYDGDGRTDTAVFRPANGTWYVKYSGQTGPSTDTRNFGLATDIPQPGDYDGDGRADYAVYRPGGTWYVRHSATGATATLAYGTGGDVPVAGDWDGDGRVDHAVFRASTGAWYVRRSWNATSVVIGSWGVAGDRVLPADFDGDGQLDMNVFRPSNGTWYTRTRLGATLVRAWGVSTDVPVLVAR